LLSVYPVLGGVWVKEWLNVPGEVETIEESSKSKGKERPGVIWQLGLQEMES
jgi:hypothetical protein